MVGNDPLRGEKELRGVASRRKRDVGADAAHRAASTTKAMDPAPKELDRSRWCHGLVRAQIIVQDDIAGAGDLGGAHGAGAAVNANEAKSSRG